MMNLHILRRMLRFLASLQINFGPMNTIQNMVTHGSITGKTMTRIICFDIITPPCIKGMLRDIYKVEKKPKSANTVVRSSPKVSTSLLSPCELYSRTNGNLENLDEVSCILSMIDFQ